MNRDQSSLNISLPGDYRKAAERLFPKNGFPKGQKPDLKAIGDYAKALGIGVEYQRLLALDSGSGELQKFLEHFQINLDLLIRKTWVEKHDEIRKNTLQDEVPSFMTTLEKGDYAKSIGQFSSILDELAYLLFGAQSEKGDFSEYTFRIDTQMGLFWWYGSKLDLLNEVNNDKVSWALLLLGLCYLTNF